MSHLYERLKLLYDSTLWCEYVIFHVSLCQEVPLVFQMVYNSHLVPTICAIADGVVKNSAVKPCAVIECNRLGCLVVVIHLVGQVVSLIKFRLINDDFLRIISDFNLRMSQIKKPPLRIICVGNVELEVAPCVFENQ